MLRIDCTKFGSGAYSIPISVEHLQFETNARLYSRDRDRRDVPAAGEAQLLEKANCILISMGGVPTRACRRFIRRLADFKKIPVYVFVDGDPYGITNIYRTLKVGSGNAAHLNEFFCVPQARFLGITPQDIVDYKLPTHPLKDVDIKRARDAIKNDPFIRHYQRLDQRHRASAQDGSPRRAAGAGQTRLELRHRHYLPEKLRIRNGFSPEKAMPKAQRTAKASTKQNGLLHYCLMDRPTPAAVPFWILIAPLLGFAAVVSYFQICSPDLWWHLKTGEWIWQQHSFPQGDPFSYTAAGQPWIAHEWLFGLVSFLAWRAVGLAGLIGIKAFLVADLLALTAWTARARGATAGMTVMVLSTAFTIPANVLMSGRS